MRKLFLIYLLFIAPLASAQQGTGQVQGTGLITVQPVPNTATVSVSPNAGNIAAGGTIAFTGTVTSDPQNLGVAWALSGAQCSGVTCGTLSSSQTVSGASITYTAPATAPSDNTVVLTAAPVIAPNNFVTVPINVTSQTGPTPIVVFSSSSPANQSAAATNSYLISPTQGNSPIVGIGESTGTTTTAVQIGTVGGTYFPLTQTCPPSGSCFGLTMPGGRSNQWAGFNLPTGLTSVVVTNSPAVGNIDLAIIDASNITGFGTAAQLSAQASSSNPVGACVTPTTANGIVVSVATTNAAAVTSVSSPFVFQALSSGDGLAYELSSDTSQKCPTWATPGGGTWSAFSGYYVGNGSTGPPIVSVAIAPATASLAASATQNFVATVTNGSKGVNWTLTGSGCSGATCGTLSLATTGSGVATIYTAPATAPNPPLVALTATSIDDPTKKAVAAINVTSPPIVVNLSPGSASPVVSTTQTFNCVVTNDPANGGCDWTLTGSGCSGATCGTLSTAHTASGVNLTYTAPASVPSPALVTITATSKTDPTQNDTSPITVVAAPVLTVSISPGTATVALGGTKAFTPTVTNDGSNLGVDWTFTCTNAPCGSLSLAHTASGVSTTYTAPASGPSNTVTLTAKSTTDATKLATSTITVNAAANISVSIAPAATNCAGNAIQKFIATVTNDAQNLGVDWTLAGNAPLGSISPAHTAAGAPVTYTAPSSAPSPPTVTIRATSTADATKSSASTVTVSSATVTVVVAPSNASLASGASTNFTATVINGTSGVTWSASCSGSCGSFSPASTASGTPTTYTAPPVSATQTVTVTATSVDDGTKSATAMVTVSPVSGPPGCTGGNCAAFPGAQGSGSLAHGGRGGPIGGSTADGTPVVMYVTNTNDAGAGSLRTCVEANGPRTCIFRVGGNINLQSRLVVSNPYITVAGQSATGSGIWTTFPGCTDCMWWIETHDVVIRYVGCSAENPQFDGLGPSGGTGCFLFISGTQYNDIVDHVSMRWWTNKGLIFGSNVGGGPTHDVTMQWSLVYEPNQAHPVCIMFDDTDSNAQNDTNQDMHHNMLVNCDHRMPLWNTRSGRLVSNLVYDYGTSNYAFLSQGGTSVDIVNNRYVAGNLGGNSFQPFMFNNSQSGDSTGGMGGPPSTFMSGNVKSSSPSDTTGAPSNQLNLTAQGSEGGQSSAPAPSGWFRSTRLADSAGQAAYPISEDPALNLGSLLTPTVGNSQILSCTGTWMSNRNSQDSRIINQWNTNGTGQYYNDQIQSPPPIAGTPCATSQNDGIPDAWKTKYGLSTSNPNLWRAKDPVTQEIYLYDYLNGLVP